MTDLLSQFMLFQVPYDWATLLTRLACGLALLPYPIKKARTIRETAPHFPAVLGLSSTTSFYLAMFMEFSCSICMILGLFTRLAAIGGICTMGIATNVSRGKYFTSPAQIYCLIFLVILITGPGVFSLDQLIFG